MPAEVAADPTEPAEPAVPPGGPADRRPATGSLRVAGVVLGAGIGGFVDGIVLHQLLQWHHLLTDHGRYADFPPGTVAELEDNTLADGLFHAGTWVATVVGLALLWRALARGRPASWRALAGPMLIGWGLFNLVEGVVDHHVLSIHHVRDDVADPLWWDVGFLAVGAALVLLGLAVTRSATRAARR